MSSRGITRERRVRALLESEDWIVFRAAGSLGSADLVALRDGSRPRLIEVKTSSRGPFQHFPPASRDEMVLASRLAGATAQLCWWPPRAKRPLWIDADAWPRAPEPVR